MVLTGILVGKNILGTETNPTFIIDNYWRIWKSVEAENRLAEDREWIEVTANHYVNGF